MKAHKQCTHSCKNWYLHRDGWHKIILRAKREKMMVRRKAAFLYAIITLAIVAFQIALAAGAPWGAFAMGGAFPG